MAGTAGLSIIIFCGLILSTWAAVFLAPATINPDYPGQCWIAKQNKAYKIGQSWTEPSCMRASCSYYRSKLFVDYATCGAVGGSEGCIKVQDFSKSYPDCCPTLNCINRHFEFEFPVA